MTEFIATRYRYMCQVSCGLSRESKRLKSQSKQLLYLVTEVRDQLHNSSGRENFDNFFFILTAVISTLTINTTEDARLFFELFYSFEFLVIV